MLNDTLHPEAQINDASNLASDFAFASELPTFEKIFLSMNKASNQI